MIAIDTAEIVGPDWKAHQSDKNVIAFA
jgi:hypothetical protein